MPTVTPPEQQQVAKLLQFPDVRPAVYGAEGDVSRPPLQVRPPYPPPPHVAQRLRDAAREYEQIARSLYDHAVAADFEAHTGRVPPRTRARALALAEAVKRLP